MDSANQSNAITPKRFVPHLGEVVVVLLLSALFLVANLVTASRSPTVWYDEVAFIDPAVSLYLGQGFKSAGWYSQTKDEIFAGSPPLHQVLLSQWLKLTGFSIVGVRSMNYVLMLCAALLLWAAAFRLRLVAGMWPRLALFALVLCGYGITFVYRSGRIDSLHILLTSAFVFVCSLRVEWLRTLLIGFIGVAASLAGFQFVAYSALLVPLAWIFVGKSFTPQLVAFGLGGAFGMALLYGYVMVVGAAGRFSETTAQFFLQFSWPSGYGDYSFVVLFLSALVILIRSKIVRQLRWRSPLVYAVVAVIVVPLGVTVLGRYPIYYSWMAWLPLVFGFCAAISEEGLLEGTASRVAVTIVVFIACVIGLPARLVLTAIQWQERDYAPVEELLERTVSHADWVYIDYEAFYATKPRAGLTMLPGYQKIAAIAEKERVSVLVIRPESFADTAKFFGGDWLNTGEAVAPTVGSHNLGARKYDLRVYRRDLPR